LDYRGFANPSGRHSYQPVPRQHILQRRLLSDGFEFRKDIDHLFDIFSFASERWKESGVTSI